MTKKIIFSLAGRALLCCVVSVVRSGVGAG